jgi:hypothetical protein
MNTKTIAIETWYCSPDQGQLCRVIETQTLWGDTTCRVWLPGSDSVVRIPASILDREEREWHAQLEHRAQVIPEMVPLLLIRLDGGSANE